MNELLTIRQVVEIARANLPPHLWDHAVGGAGAEVTLRRNRRALDRLTLRPRLLRGVDRVDTSTTFLGHPLALPVMLAPVGTIGHYCPDGALASAQAAGAAGTAAFVGCMSAPAVEDVSAATRRLLVFQVYPCGGPDWLEQLVRRAERAGCGAICLTADTPAYGRLERDLRHRFFGPARLERPNLSALPTVTEEDARRHMAAFDWGALARLRRLTRLPLVLKGVLDAEDARLAVGHGVDAICVSNHGGRHLDSAPASCDVLPEIVAATGGSAEVIVDGGFMHGTDVLKALALGARAVLLGKLQVLALAAGGAAALTRTLAIVGAELRTTMANVGVRTVAEVGAHVLRPAGHHEDGHHEDGYLENGQTEGARSCITDV